MFKITGKDGSREWVRYGSIDFEYPTEQQIAWARDMSSEGRQRNRDYYNSRIDDDPTSILLKDWYQMLCAIDLIQIELREGMYAKAS